MLTAFMIALGQLYYVQLRIAVYTENAFLHTNTNTHKLQNWTATNSHIPWHHNETYDAIMYALYCTERTCYCPFNKVLFSLFRVYTSS